MAFPAAQPFWTWDWELQDGRAWEKEKHLPEKTQRKSQQGRQGWKGEQKQVSVSQKGKVTSKALPAYGNREAHVGNGFYMTQKPLQGFAETIKSIRTFWWNKHGLNSLQGFIFRGSKWTDIFTPKFSPSSPSAAQGDGEWGLQPRVSHSQGSLSPELFNFRKRFSMVKGSIYESCQDFVVSQIY